MRTRLLSTTGVLLAAGVLSTAQPASAALARPTGNPPRGLPCADNGSGAKACFQAKGDRMWVKDDAIDGASAVGVWQEYTGDAGWSKGYCRNKLGFGHWGACRLHFIEGSYVKWWAAEYDAQTSSWTDWSADQSATS